MAEIRREELSEDELRALIPEWKWPDVPENATEADLREILAEIDADDPPLLTS